MVRVILILTLCPLVAFAAPVNINEADAESISEALTGIGPKKAEAIVEYRKQHGPFGTLDDLEKVNGIGGKTIKMNEKDILFSDGATEKLTEKKMPEKPGNGGGNEKAGR